MQLEMNSIFYCELWDVIGEVVGQDGNYYIGKFYDFKERGIPRTSYGKIPTSHVIVGKKAVMELLDSYINDAKNILNKTPISQEKKYQYATPKMIQMIHHNENLMNELNNILNKQTIEFSETRNRQVGCIMKAIRRNMNRMRGIQCRLNEKPKNNIEIQRRLLQLEDMKKYTKTL